MREPSREEILKVVKEWIQDARKFVEKGHISVSRIMTCPRCKRNMLEYDERCGWHCLYRDCYFRFPEDIEVLSPRQLEVYFENEELKKLVKIFGG